MTVADFVAEAASRFDLDRRAVIAGDSYFARSARAWAIRNAIDGGHSIAKTARVLGRHRSTVREIYNRVREG